MDALSQLPLTLNLTKNTLAAGTTTTISTTGTATFAIKDKIYTKTAITNGATPVLDHSTGLAFPPLVLNQGTVVVISLDAAGTIRASQGQIEALDANGSFIIAPNFPGVPDTDCPIGYIILQAGATLSGTWIFGTNNLSSVTGMTYTFVDILAIPARPQVS